jgi:tetratricopeptide (TPR) repeat protein
MKKLIYILIPLFFFMLLSDVFAAAGKISKMGGEVFYRPKANIKYETAKEGIEFEVGCWIKTGKKGWAKLALSDGSSFTLANNTEFEIDKFVVGSDKKDGLFNLSQGKIRATVSKLAGQQVSYKVKSPTAVAGVKGTEFMMLTQGYANVFFGNEGSVEVSGDGKGDKPLSVDTMVQNTRGIIPTDPVKVEPDTPLSTAKKSFEQITSGKPPIEWESSGNLPQIIARWNINYGRYLADSGKYEEAVYIFQIALDLTDNPEIKGAARLERGAVYASFLRNPDAALAEYLLILEEYPENPQRETALYRAGVVLYEMGFMQKAKERLLQYKQEFPSGKYNGNIETILKTIPE